MPNKVELQWLKAINSKDDIELTMKNIEHKLEELKNLEGASI